MYIILKKTKASLKRRKELQIKIKRLLSIYSDVPILVTNKLDIILKKGEQGFDFRRGEQKRQVHIMLYNSFFSAGFEYKKLETRINK